MVRFLFCCFWHPSPPSLDEIQYDLRGPLARRRRLAEKIVIEEEVRAQLSSTMDNLRRELIRRLNFAKSSAGLIEENDEEICRKCWSGELYPWYGPSPERVSKDLLESEFRLAARWESLEVVHHKVCRLQDECAEALRRECPGQHLAREEFDTEALMLPIPLELVDPLDEVKASVSVTPRPLKLFSASASVMATSNHGTGGPDLASGEPQQVVDWDAKTDAAHRKLKASSVRVRRSLKRVDHKHRHHHRHPASGPQGEGTDAVCLKDRCTHSHLAVPVSGDNLKDDMSLSCSSAKCLTFTIL